MDERQKELFWEIIQCGISNCLCEAGQCHCLAIDQKEQGVDSFQVPEPWNGDIANARVVMVSINPGLTPTEEYPAQDGTKWPRALVEDFFEHRFDSNHEWVVRLTEHTFGILQQNGERVRYAGYWNYAQSIGRRILGERAEIGRDILLTEIVHCKSRNALALNQEVYEECFNRFFDRVIGAVNNVKAIVVVGSEPMKIVSNRLGINEPKSYTWYEKNLGNRSVKIMFVPHNAAGGTARRMPDCDWYEN